MDGLTPAGLLDVAGAARLVGFTQKAVRARVARQQLPFHRLGARIFFRRAELLDFVCQLAGVDAHEALRNAEPAGFRAKTPSQASLEPAATEVMP